jgi:hypothetical protein
MKGEGAEAVVRAKADKCARKPESMTSCSRRSGLANLRRKMREERSYTLARRRETREVESSWAMILKGDVSMRREAGEG